jgi:4,5:9,10-diseco-3-hydroxy-5,9,17-trioxoandrosta-1(10),2-diene-4-oate hydrolase
MGSPSAAGLGGGSAGQVAVSRVRSIPIGKHADIGGSLLVHYHEHGQGTPLVFLHGSGPGASGFSNFSGNFPFFAERGFRTLLPDTLGFGHSSKPADVDYHLDFLVGALERFLDVAGVSSCAVVGNSHGGAMAIALAVKRPELVKKLVLMAPGGLEERDRYLEMKGIRTMVKAVLSPEGITRESLRKLLALQLYDPALLTDELVDQRFEIAELQPKRVLSSLVVPHLTPELSKIECPVFGLWGTGDQFCPVSGAMRIAEGCTDARVLVLSRCGHWVMVEHAALFNRLCLDFLEE